MASDPRKRILLAADHADEEEVDEALPLAPLPSATVAREPHELVTPILPSPYPQHHTGSSRYKTALNRILVAPTTDAEAWQVLLTEVHNYYKTIRLHSLDAETHRQLDWVESCYGTLLTTFPYAADTWITLLNVWFAQSARYGEPNGPSTNTPTSQRALRCDAKLDYWLPRLLGLNETKLQQNETELGLCAWKVELWLLLVEQNARTSQREGQDVRLARLKAFQTAAPYAGFGHDNHVFWKAYLEFVQSWVGLQSTDHALIQEQRQVLRSVFQQLVALPMRGLDQYWQQYENWERQQSEQLAQALIQEWSPKYQHARTIFLERQRVYTVTDLKLNRLAAPPPEKKQVQSEDEEEDTNKDDAEYWSKMKEDYQLLEVWKRRLAYERTNPERLGPSDLAVRIRSAFKELLCVLSRHPECWHMWSTWEFSATGSIEVPVAVLQLGQKIIADSTLLAYAEVQLVEQHADDPSSCLAVLERFLDRSPTTLGYILYQQCVRRYRGVDAARAVFAKARRVLKNMDAPAEVENALEAEGGEATSTGQKRWMVTNRLDPKVGTAANATEALDLKNEGDATEPQAEAETVVEAGPITWHLYAAHATIEHRLNRLPEVAARVFELGLRKHASFLTKPPFVKRYAQLLLELGDSMNLRALLTRAVASCEGKEHEEALASLWDLTLYFESLTSGADQESVLALQKIERQRRAALLGSDVEDVATGGFLGIGDPALIGAQKSTISEQLVRTEGYDLGSSIVNGMTRAVDLLEIMGIWGDGESEIARARRRLAASTESDKAIDISGGRSDANYQRRLQYQLQTATGASAEDATNGATNRSSSTRDRANPSLAAPGQPTAITLAIQQMPEWLRPLLLMLPASRLRLPVVAKPPPHLAEMALSTLRVNALPSERPPDTSGKRKRDDGDDSSDEENGMGGAGGYSSQFRARQRARIGAMPNGDSLS